MAEPISIQQLKDASEDAISLADFINKPENVMIPRRLSADINSLQYYLDYMTSFAQRSYETYDEMVANVSNLSENVSVFVTNDSDTSKNGIYTYNGTSFVKGEYQPENAAKEFVEAKLGGLQVFDGKVRAQDVSTADGSTQAVKNTEFRNELDGLPFEGGVLADTFVTATAQSETRIARPQSQKNSDMVSAKDFGAKGDGVTDDAINIQKNIDWTEDVNASYVYLPNLTESYLLSTHLRFKQPTKFFGFKGATYNRGRGKKGNLLIGESATHAISLGDYRTSSVEDGGNPSDAFTVSNIGILQAEGVALRTKDGIIFNAATDGPDRGGGVIEVSTRYLNKAISIADTGKSTMYATLTIERCCLSNNNYALYSDGGMIQNLRFVANQAEQNSKGAIHAACTSGAYIADNMLEGQPNAINITIPPITGNRLKLVVERNYFESMSGEYIISVATNHPHSYVLVQNNYIPNSIGNTDYLRIATSSASLTVINRDPYPVTFILSPLLRPESEIVSSIMPYYLVRSVRQVGSTGATIMLRNDRHLPDTQGHTHRTFGTSSKVSTPYGLIGAYQGTGYIRNITGAVEEGDLISLNIYMKCKYVAGNTLGWQVFNNDYTATIGENVITGVLTHMNNDWMLINITFRAKSATTESHFKFNNSGGGAEIMVAGIAIKNYGYLPNDRTETVKVYPTMPEIINITDISQTYEAVELAAGETKSKTFGALSARLGDALVTGFDKPLKGTRMWAEVTSTQNITIYHRNDTAASVTVDAGTVTIKTI